MGGNRKISLRLAKGPQLAGRFSLRGDFFPPGADFGPSVSARGNPVSQRKASASCRWPAPALAMWQIEHTSELF
jgi:hypothetical protein